MKGGAVDSVKVRMYRHGFGDCFLLSFFDEKQRVFAMLVDCGMDTPECLEALARAVEGVGLRWNDITHLLLTHIHPDHMGLAPRLAEMTGAGLYLHRADAELLDFVSDHEGFVVWQSDVLASAGVPAAQTAAIWAAMAEVQKSFQRLPSSLNSQPKTLNCVSYLRGGSLHRLVRRSA